jgi:hypothetical protein
MGYGGHVTFTKSKMDFLFYTNLNVIKTRADFKWRFKVMLILNKVFFLSHQNLRAEETMLSFPWLGNSAQYSHSAIINI